MATTTATKAPRFDHKVFRNNAHQLADFAPGYRLLGLGHWDAIAWANIGCTPEEAAPWTAAGWDAAHAHRHIDAFRTPAEAHAWDHAQARVADQVPWLRNAAR